MRHVIPTATLFLLALAAPSAAQGPEDSASTRRDRLQWARLATESEPDTALRHAPVEPVMDVDGIHGLGDTPSGLLGFGPGYHVRFGPDGPLLTVLHPEDGAHASVAIELTEVRRGKQQLWAAGGSPRAFATEDAAVTYPLTGGMTERFDVRADGIEQSLVLEQRPEGVGDLTMRTRLAGDLVATVGEHAQGFELRRGGETPVRVGAAVAIDGQGERTPLPARWTGDEIVLTLPHEFLESAAYPLVLDPLIGPGWSGSPGFLVRELDTAYDETHDLFGCLLQREGDQLSFFLRFDRFGAPVGTAYPVDFCRVGSFGVSLANNNEGDWFVGAIDRTPGKITLVSFDATPGSGSLDFLDVGVPAVLVDFELGGELLPPYDAALLAYAASSSGKFDLRTQRVWLNSNGVLSLVDSVATSQYEADPGVEIANLALTKTGGLPGHWGLAWQETGALSVPAPATANMTTVAYDNTRTTHPMKIFGFVAAHAPAVAGDGTNFAVAFPFGGCFPAQGGSVIATTSFYRDVDPTGMRILSLEESWQWGDGPVWDPWEHVYPSIVQAAGSWAVAFSTSERLACLSPLGGASEATYLADLIPGVSWSAYSTAGVSGVRAASAMALAESVTPVWPGRALLFVWDTKTAVGRPGMAVSVIEAGL